VALIEPSLTVRKERKPPIDPRLLRSQEAAVRELLRPSPRKNPRTKDLRLPRKAPEEVAVEAAEVAVEALKVVKIGLSVNPERMTLTHGFPSSITRLNARSMTSLSRSTLTLNSLKCLLKKTSSRTSLRRRTSRLLSMLWMLK
jgi:hypothetical protein